MYMDIDSGNIHMKRRAAMGLTADGMTGNYTWYYLEITCGNQ